jgi:hypothetical protein
MVSGSPTKVHDNQLDKNLKMVKCVPFLPESLSDNQKPDYNFLNLGVNLRVMFQSATGRVNSVIESPPRTMEMQVILDAGGKAGDRFLWRQSYSLCRYWKKDPK